MGDFYRLSLVWAVVVVIGVYLIMANPVISYDEYGNLDGTRAFGILVVIGGTYGFTRVMQWIEEEKDRRGGSK